MISFLLLAMIVPVHAGFYFVIIFDEDEEGNIIGVDPITYAIWAALLVLCCLGYCCKKNPSATVASTGRVQSSAVVNSNALACQDGASAL